MAPLSSIRRSIPALAALLLLCPGTSRAEPDDERFMAALVARGFLAGLLESDLERVMPLCGKKVNLDGEVVKRGDALKKALAAMAKRAKKKRLKLRKVQVLTGKEALKRFGEPPKRLKAQVKPTDMVALAALTRSGAVVVLRKEEGFYRVVLVSD